MLIPTAKTKEIDAAFAKLLGHLLGQLMGYRDAGPISTRSSAIADKPPDACAKDLFDTKIYEAQLSVQCFFTRVL